MADDERLSLDQIKALIPDGVVGGKERMTLVADLVTLAGDSPELDVDTMVETMQKAARVIFADGLRLKDWEEVRGGH